MPSLPVSLLIVGLVLAWLVVLVPMLSKGRETVPESDDDVAGFRVLRRSRMRRRSRAELEETTVGTTESPDFEGRVLVTSEARRRSGNPDMVDTVQIERSDPAGGAADASFDASDEWAQEHQDVSAARQVKQPPVTASYSDEHSFDDSYDRWEAESLAAPRYRAGRGGFDPEMARRMAAQKFRRRRTVTLALAMVGLTALISSFFVFKTALVAVAIGTALVLVGYLFYLNRTVRIERQIATRRAARLQRNRMIRPQISRPAPAPTAATAYAPSPGSVGVNGQTGYPPQSTHVHRTRMEQSAPAARTGHTMVECDDDDPAFDELDYYQPVVFRRAVGQ